jgi:hypothetical protein
MFVEGVAEGKTGGVLVRHIFPSGKKRMGPTYTFSHRLVDGLIEGVGFTPGQRHGNDAARMAVGLVLFDDVINSGDDIALHHPMKEGNSKCEHLAA